MTSERRGDWQQTFTGRQAWALDPRPEDIDVRDIAHSLALQCRFAGHCRQPYSVAEHSVRVSFVAEKAYRGYHEHTRNGEAVIRTYTLAALLHDASEAYCVDVPRPLKPYLTGYKDIERLVTDAVERWANLPAGACEEWNIKHADEVLLATEARDLMCAPPASWDLRADPLPEIIEPWGWERAEREFLARFEALRTVPDAR